MDTETINTELAFEYPADLSLDLRNKVKCRNIACGFWTFLIKITFLFKDVAIYSKMKLSIVRYRI